MKAADWIAHLGLLAHPEGGYYQETYRSQEIVAAGHLPARFNTDHHFSTAIYYLLQAPDFSAFHQIKQDELWHFYHGSGLTIHVITADGDYQTLKLGSDPRKGQAFQQVVKAGDWFAASVDDFSVDDSSVDEFSGDASSNDGTQGNQFALVGCTVAPGFEFADFELANQTSLIKAFPKHQTLIRRFTR